MIITPNQTQGKCPEDHRIKKSLCTKDSDCQYLAAIPGGHGKDHFICVPSSGGLASPSTF